MGDLKGVGMEKPLVREEEKWVFQKEGEREALAVLREWLQGDPFLHPPREKEHGWNPVEGRDGARQLREVWGGWRGKDLLGLVVLDFYPRASGAELTLVVNPGFRRRGVGGFLLEKIASMAESVGLPWLEVSVDQGNTGARLFFERWGFTSIRGAAPGKSQLRFRIGG